MNKKQIQTLLFTLIISFSACKNNEVESTASTYTIKGDTVYINDKDVFASKIITSEVAIQPYVKEIVTAGTVQPIPTQFAYIAPPFSGRVVKSYIKLGQKVKMNTPLFEIVSPDFTIAQKEFFQAQSEKELAQKELTRKQDLLDNGVGSQKELEEAISIMQIAEKEYENAYAALLVYQTNPDNMTLGQSLIVRSPISGNVIANNIITGLYIKDDSEPIATIADISKVWISAQVKEKDIRFIHEGDEMHIHVSAYPDDVIKGTVFYVDEAVDEETRSIRVLSVCDNKDELLKLGMYATVYFQSKAADYIQIPEKALLQGEKDSYVFVEVSPNVYARTSVDVETTKDGVAIIADGLTSEAKVISEGGYYLK